MADSQIISITASLVREYLSRKGLKATLQTLDKEMPRTEDSISNRAQLAKEMHIEKLMKKNKELPEPFRTMLEVIVQYMKERDNQNSSSSVGTDRSSQRSNSTRESKKETRSRTTALRSNSDLINDPDKQSDKEERKDYDDLLKRVEKPASNFHASFKDNKKETKSRTTSQPSNNDLINDADKQDDKDGGRDYGDLLKRLEKPASDFASSKTSMNPSSDLRTKGGKQKEESHKGMLDASDTGGAMYSSTVASMSSSDQIAKQKSKRRLNNTMGGPVISSGLAAKKDARNRHSAGRLSNSLTTKQVGSLFGDDEQGKGIRGTSILQTQKQDALDYKLDALHSAEDFQPLDEMGKDRHQQAEVTSPKQPRKSALQKSSRNQPVSNSRSQKSKHNDLVFEDIDDDLDQDLGQLSLGPRKIAPVDVESKPISLETAMGLKNLLFGNPKVSFTPEWRNQSFSFCDLYGLEYGIVQLKGGPCGVLAAVQGFVLKHLLFGGKKGDAKKKLQPSARERTKALASAITEILWRAGDSKGATVALPTGGSNVLGAGRYKPDQLTEALVLYTFRSSESLHSFVSQNITQFESDSSSGCILLLYSVILSKSIETLRSDMDEPKTNLMGAHGYCTQEMVNLLITGKAVSNTFDNIIEVDTGGAKKNVFKGLEKQSDIGLLSLFEHYKSCEVGVNFKTPKFPIWVVCSESHFSVLFSVDRNLLDDWRLEKKFDLYYYDGLARQDEELRLTVDTTKDCPEYKDTDLVPPLEHCIRTRWKNAVIDWNGSEPIL